MPWDDELDRLATYAKEHFGIDAVQQAGSRAIASLTPLDFARDEAADTDEVIEGDDGHIYDIDEFWEAVRRELRKLVAPH